MKFQITTRERHIIRVSQCGRFRIIQPNDSERSKWWLEPGHKYVLREVDPSPEGGGLPISLGSYRTLRECKAAAKVAESQRLEVMPYFEEMAEHDGQTATKQYNYKKYRAMRTDGTGRHIDPFAFREWQAIITGTYVQWWDRHDLVDVCLQGINP